MKIKSPPKAIRKKTVKKTTKKIVKKTSAYKQARAPKPFRMTLTDIEKIANSLGAGIQNFGNHYRIMLDNPVECRKLTLEIYPDVAMGESSGTLITVYTPNAHLQLHHCSGYVISELLGEVTFIGTLAGRLSGLTIEKGAACSLYANVEAKLLSGDLTQLGPEVMLSSIALSLTEPIVLQTEETESQ